MPEPCFSSKLQTKTVTPAAAELHLLLCQCCSTKLQEELLIEGERKHDSSKELNRRGFSVQWPPAISYLQGRRHPLVMGTPQIPALGWGAGF